MTDTLIVISEQSIDILASKKKIEFLQPLRDAQKKVEGVPPIKLLLRTKVSLKECLLSLYFSSMRFLAYLSVFKHTKVLQRGHLSLSNLFSAMYHLGKFVFYADNFIFKNSWYLAESYAKKVLGDQISKVFKSHKSLN